MTIRFLIYLLLLFAAVMIGVYRFKNIATPFKILFYLLICTLISEIVTRILVKAIKNSSPAYHFYLPIQFILLFLIYSLLFRVNEKRIIIVVICVSITINFLNSFYFQSLLRFPSNMALLNSSIFIMFSLFYFKKMLQVVSQKSIFRQSVFWFNSGVLIFFSTTFLFWGFYNFLLKSHISTKPISTVIYFVNILIYSMFSVGLLLNEKKSISA